MEELIAALQAHTPNPDSVLALFYEAFNKKNPVDDDTINKNFHILYERINDMTLRETDRIIDPVYTLCRDHERSGFIHDVQIGMQLAQELK